MFVFVQIRANGYRTLVTAHGQAASQTLEILRQLDSKRVGLLFNLMYSSRLFQDLESWTKTLGAMRQLLVLAKKMVEYSEKKLLYVSRRRKVKNRRKNQSKKKLTFSDRCKSSSSRRRIGLFQNGRIRIGIFLWKNMWISG